MCVRARVSVGIKVGHTAAASMIWAGMDDTVCLQQIEEELSLRRIFQAQVVRVESLLTEIAAAAGTLELWTTAVFSCWTESDEASRVM